jgi:prefoldin subunit 5
MTTNRIFPKQISVQGAADGYVLSSNGTAALWQLGASSTNTASQFTWTNNHTFNANLTIAATGELIIAAGAGISANGSFGTAGQVLTSNASSIYWASTASVDPTYVQNTDSRTLSGNLVFSGANNTFSGNLTISSTGELIVSAGAGISANNSFGTTGQYLTSNGSSIFWSTASGGGATLSNETSSATTHYPAMSTTSTGSWSSAIVSTTKLYFTPSTGQLNATIFNSLSDENAKKDIQTIENALDTVNNIRGVKFNWKENDIPSMGLIAQEIEQYLPELVHTTQEGEKSVNYGGIVGVLIEAIKELSDRVKKLEGK